MIITAYHGTSSKIEYFDLNHLGVGQGQSVFAGIYFTTDKNSAIDYAQMDSERTGRPPRVYAAELELKNPLYASKGQKFFVTRSAFIDFLKDYFPSWFEKDGSLKRIKRDYVNEKFSTYQGQYNLIKFAAEENNLRVTEIEEDLGFDSLIDGVDIAIANPNSILSFEEIIGPGAEKESATESIADYCTIRDRYLIDSRHGQNYKTMPGNRYKRRLRIRTEGGNRVWYDIDVNLFFNKDKFLFHIPVIGETDEYVVEIEIENWLPILRSDIQRDGFSVKAFKNSLAKAFRTLNIKLHDTCPDFKYRFAYWFSLFGDNSGQPETRPTKETNPKNNLGRGCKHINFVLANTIWIARIARIFFNYCFNLYKTNKPLFERTIAKKLSITDDMVENRPLERRKLSPQPQPLPEEPVEPQKPTGEQPEKVEEVQEKEEEEEEEIIEKPAGEAYYSGYYRTAKSFDADQQYMIDSAKDNKINVLPFITPQNSPEQIWEVTRDIQSHLKPELIKILSSPDLSLQEHQILREAYLKKVDLFPFIGVSPDILKQLYLGAKQGIDPKELLVKGKNYRQLEQLRTIYKLDKRLFDKVKNLDLNYEQLKALIKKYKERENK